MLFNRKQHVFQEVWYVFISIFAEFSYAVAGF